MIASERNCVLRSFLLASVLLGSELLFSTAAQAEREKGSPTQGSTTVDSSGGTSSEPGDPGMPIDKPADCRDILDSYKDFIADPYSQLEDSVVQAIKAVFTKDEKCPDKVSEIEDILNAYWATEPWCRKDRDTFVTRYTPEVVAKLTTEAQAVVTALLSQGNLTCSETLSAAVTVVRFYDPTFVLYDNVIPVDGTPMEGATSARPGLSSKVEFNVDDAARSRSSKRKLKACQAKVKKLTRR